MLYCNFRSLGRQAIARGESLRAGAALGARWLHVWRTLLCVAFLAQSVLVQSHVHDASAGASPASYVQQVLPDRHVSLAKDDPTGAADFCLLCWEGAMAGQYVLPPAAATLLAPPVLIAAEQAALAQWALRQPPRGWRGRAPPQ